LLQEGADDSMGERPRCLSALASCVQSDIRECAPWLRSNPWILLSYTDFLDRILDDRIDPLEGFFQPIQVDIVGTGSEGIQIFSYVTNDV
jgi:hypothetical protein